MDAVEEGHGGCEEYQVVPSVVQRSLHRPSRLGRKEWMGMEKPGGRLKSQSGMACAGER
jgi:hypothetical protein